jgi:hypothetical protein
LRTALFVPIALAALCACRSGNSEEPTYQAGPGKDGSAGAADGGADRPPVTATRVCKDHQPPAEVVFCRDSADCRDRYQQCQSPTRRTGLPEGCITGAAPPRSQCNTDLDCAAGKRCRPEKFICHEYGVCFDSSCVTDGCPTGQRCRPADGKCEYILCTEGHACRPDQMCMPDPRNWPSTDLHGCAPRWCTMGYTCPEGRPVCELGGFEIDAHGCRPRNCREGVACPSWLRCETQPHLMTTKSFCAAIPCTRDADCSCGSCFAGYCEPTPGICRYPDTGPP